MTTSKSTWFISDLHLDPSRPHLFKLFTNFIDDISEQAEALYILGDLFEAWIGDDIIDLPFGEPYLPVINKLKALADSGTRLYFMQGNRDFLAQDVFAKRIGAELLPDQKVIDLYGEPTLLLHGDTLCTDDKSYQRMRRFFRLKIIQFLYLSLSPNSRIEKATRVRNISKNKT
ncbi:MAG: UDP-2,3-diacylglucosamine diphosphatase, partial [Cocleimonas sp.]|nr:UDP-2,3-diacylglucosamine diphosphatase [Cocleimonas sp.]